MCKRKTDDGRSFEVTRSWVKDGVALSKTDTIYLAVQDTDDYHPENIQKNTELQTFRDGEIIARIWWVR